MGNSCQCLEGLNTELDLKHTNKKKRTITETDEEKLLKSSRVVNKRPTSFMIDKEISMAINTTQGNNQTIQADDLKNDKSLMKSEFKSRKSSIGSVFDHKDLAESMFELINELRIEPFTILSKIANVYLSCDIKNNTKDTEKHKDNLIFDSESMYNTDNDTLETYMSSSIKEQKYKELKDLLTELNNKKRIQHSAIMWSEKCYCFLSEIISNPFKQRSSEAVNEYLSLQFNCKFNFLEINFTGCDNALLSLTKALFENFISFESLLLKQFNFGSVNVLRNVDGLEYSLFLAYKENKESLG